MKGMAWKRGTEMMEWGESSGSSAILQKTIRLYSEIECVMGQRVSLSLQDHKTKDKK